jgi:hypothetical protein
LILLGCTRGLDINLIKSERSELNDLLEKINESKIDFDVRIKIVDHYLRLNETENAADTLIYLFNNFFYQEKNWISYKQNLNASKYIYEKEKDANALYFIRANLVVWEKEQIIHLSSFRENISLLKAYNKLRFHRTIGELNKAKDAWKQIKEEWPKQKKWEEALRFIKNIEINALFPPVDAANLFADKYKLQSIQKRLENITQSINKQPSKQNENN